MIKKIYILCLAGLLSIGLKSTAQSLYFPPVTGNTWDTISPQSLGWCVNYVDSIYNYLNANSTKAFILLKDGKIVLEKYFGSFTQDSLWYWASAGKSLTALTVGIAQQEGLLNIDDSSSTYLGSGWTVAPASKEKLISIRDQLSMTSGLNDTIGDPHCTIDTCLKYLADAGTRWAYHNGPYTVLDGVISNATGMSLNNYINQKIKTPTGMTGLFVPSGFNNVFYSKARSMARFGLLILNKGKWDNTPVLNDTSYFHEMTHSSQNLNPSYGYLWWLNGQSSFMAPGLQFNFPGWLNPSGPQDLIMALGKNGQMVNVVPSKNLVYIRMGNNPDNSDVPFLFNDTIWQKLNLLMCQPNSIKSETEKTTIDIYPNPSRDLFFISLSSEAKEIRIEDLMGRTKYQSAGNSSLPQKMSISTLNWIPGIYVIRIRIQNRWLYQKIHIQ
jgi:CubicO group peptidase (beta-lactamase class C family)